MKIIVQSTVTYPYLHHHCRKLTLLVKFGMLEELFRNVSSDILDSDIEGSINVTRNRTNGPDLTNNDIVVLENGEEKAMDERIKEIFAMTIRNSP